MLQPMNHREIEYNANKFWKANNLSLDNIQEMFPDVENEGTYSKKHIQELLIWLDETQRKVLNDDLILDYGSDCIRLYMMFEKTPKENDTYLDSWQECSLEGLYKFLGKYQRMVYVTGCALSGLSDNEVKEVQSDIDRIKHEILHWIMRDNKMPNRHNAIAAMMEGIKKLQKKLHIGEIIKNMHKHDIETAVPLSNTREMAETGKCEDVSKETAGLNNNCDDVNIITNELIIMLAPFAPCMAEDLWQNYGDIKRATSVFECNWFTFT